MRNRSAFLNSHHVLELGRRSQLAKRIHVLDRSHRPRHSNLKQHLSLSTLTRPTKGRFTLRDFSQQPTKSWHPQLKSFGGAKRGPGKLNINNLRTEGANTPRGSAQKKTRPHEGWLPCPAETLPFENSIAAAVVVHLELRLEIEQSVNKVVYATTYVQVTVGVVELSQVWRRQLKSTHALKSNCTLLH